MSYIYVNSYINFKLNKNTVKFKITTLLHSFGDYMILTVKKYLKINKKYDHEIIKEFKYILST
jgi:hypothetical protein